MGKGTVCARLKALYPQPFYSVSATTRLPRPGEVDGRDYHFITSQQFAQLIAQEQLLEWAQVHGSHCYGTPWAPVRDALAQGRQVILEIDLAGARQVKQNLPEARLIFLAPPSWDELVNRLRGRGTEDQAAQTRRLATARIELAAQQEADHVVVNTDVEETVATLVGLLGLRPNLEKDQP